MHNAGQILRRERRREIGVSNLERDRARTGSKYAAAERGIRPPRARTIRRQPEQQGRGERDVGRIGRDVAADFDLLFGKGERDMPGHRRLAGARHDIVDRELAIAHRHCCTRGNRHRRAKLTVSKRCSGRKSAAVACTWKSPHGAGCPDKRSVPVTAEFSPLASTLPST